MEIEPLAGTPLGAEARHVDIARLLDPQSADWEAFRDAVYKHGMVLVRSEEGLTPEQQYALTRQFDTESDNYGHGKTQETLTAKSILHTDLKTLPRCPQVQVIGNGFVEEHEGLKNIQLRHPHHKTFHRTVVSSDDEASGITRFYRWHIDAALYNLEPPVATSLVACKVPQGSYQTVDYADGSGDTLQVPLGTTAFVSGETMFDLLSPEDKEFALGSRVEYAPHPYVWMSKAKSRESGLGLYSEDLEVPLDELPSWQQDRIKVLPMCWRNPVTGKAALQIHPSAVRAIIRPDGTRMDDLAQVRDTVYRLQRPGISPHLVYAHDWKEGDIVVFHNRGCLHTVVGAFRPDQVRIFHQCNLAATHPVVAA